MLSTNQWWKVLLKGLLFSTILRYKAFFSILQEEVVEKGKKVVSRLPIADKKMFFLTHRDNSNFKAV